VSQVAFRLVSPTALDIARDQAVRAREVREEREANEVTAIQVQIPNLPVAIATLDEPTQVVHRELPRLFNRASRFGRELRDGVFATGAPRTTGKNQYSFRQRRGDGSWRLVTVVTFNGPAVIKSITPWSIYLPKHEEAAA
jgi:hypothetical protein